MKSKTSSILPLGVMCLGIALFLTSVFVWSRSSQDIDHNTVPTASSTNEDARDLICLNSIINGICVANEKQEESAMRELEKQEESLTRELELLERDLKTLKQMNQELDNTFWELFKALGYVQEA